MKHFHIKPSLLHRVLLFGISTLTVAGTGFPQNAVSSITISGLERPVTIRRDSRSIPYIEAASDKDAYFAQGFVTASDRLWQMDLLRRVARGETAEIFGKTALEEDKRWRRFGIARVSEETLKFISPELLSALDSYAQGVNAYIATLDEKTLPVEFRILQFRPRPWTAVDTVCIGKILADALSTTWRGDILRASIKSLSPEKIAELTNQVTPYDVVLFGSDTSPQRSAAPGGKIDLPRSALTAADREFALRESSLSRIGLFSEDLAASNNWVISGKLTADGRPILANDPHLPPAAPGIWYLTELMTPKMHVAGVSFPGVPGVILGHNDNIAWGATNVGPDVQDVYVETFGADGKYKTPVGWAEPQIRKEVIKVRSGMLSNATEAVEYEVTKTRNGPVIFEAEGKKYSLRWTALDPRNAEFEAFFKLNRSSNWNDFKNALRSYGGATQNFVFADTNGNIGWYAAGRIPIRRSGDGSLPYDGSTNEGDWVGFIPFDELPNLYNPPGGLIVTANQRTVGTSYKYTQFIRDAAAPWRARRIYDSLAGKRQITQDNVRDVQYDVYNIPLANLAGEIVKSSAASPETLAVLKDWDGKMTPESSSALLVNEIRVCLANAIAEENKPAPAGLIRERILDRAVREKQALWLPKKLENYKAFLMSCDSSVRQSLADPKRLGPDTAKWTWGNAFQARFPHPLAAAPLIGGQFVIPQIGISGSGQTPNVGPFVSMRFISTPGNWDATRHVIPLGQSGDPQSTHFRDQFAAWLDGTPQLFPFSREAIEKAAVVTIRLEPK